MKKLFISLALLVLTACQPNPPKLSATVNEEPVKIYQGSYCWNENNKEVCADTSSPEDMVKGDVPTAVAERSKLKLHFDYQPKKGSLGADIWNNGEAREQNIVNSDTIILPREPGIYIYSVYANWEEGDSSYVLQVEVK
ncbi:hypothetical protein MKZ02_23325 [Pseudobacillus sp. FSL P4-0506]|uniref:hypothetical protein n=1 Tax=unclassified Pseudobacillus TaxID=2619284 RepID=UPI0030F58686